MEYVRSVFGNSRFSLLALVILGFAVSYQNCGDGLRPLKHSNNGQFLIEEPNPFPLSFQFKSPGLVGASSLHDFSSNSYTHLIESRKNGENIVGYDLLVYDYSPDNESPLRPTRTALNLPLLPGGYVVSAFSDGTLYFRGGNSYYALDISSNTASIDHKPIAVADGTSYGPFGFNGKTFFFRTYGESDLLVTKGVYKLNRYEITSSSSIRLIETIEGCKEVHEYLPMLRCESVDKISSYFDVSDPKILKKIVLPTFPTGFHVVQADQNFVVASNTDDGPDLVAKSQAKLYKKVGDSYQEWADLDYQRTHFSLSNKLLLRTAFNPVTKTAFIEAFDIGQKNNPVHLGQYLTSVYTVDPTPYVAILKNDVAIISDIFRISMIDFRDVKNIKEIPILTIPRTPNYLVTRYFMIPSFFNMRYLVINNGGLILDFNKPTTALGTIDCESASPICLDIITGSGLKFSNAMSFTPKYPLFSDGAEKIRFIYLPPGSKIDTTDIDNWVFPKNTKIWKQFKFNDVIYETRILEKAGVGAGAANWKSNVYARRDNGDGGPIPRDPADRTILNDTFTQNKNVPHVGMCITCHGAAKDYVLGFDALDLSGQIGQFSLANLSTQGFLTIPINKPVEIQGSPNAKAALGYMQTNCGTCHSPTGVAAGVGLNLRHSSLATSLETENAYMTLTARGAIVAKSPLTSRIYIRATNPLLPMPPPFLNQILDPSVRQIFADWINEL
ncbi:MAG: hypothetical protein SGJ18_11750 [Pseudomonadota bacterium]|nr:hypothetical protein [Pseudomonadota bacterium]